MEQKDRELIMKEFRSGSSRVLITTDLLVCTVTTPWLPCLTGLLKSSSFLNGSNKISATQQLGTPLFVCYTVFSSHYGNTP